MELLNVNFKVREFLFLTGARLDAWLTSKTGKTLWQFKGDKDSFTVSNECCSYSYDLFDGSFTSRVTDKDGTITTERYEKGIFKRRILEYKDEEGVRHIEVYNKKGHLDHYRLSYRDKKGVEHYDMYNPKGKLLTKEIRTGDKVVDIDMRRTLLARLFNLFVINGKGARHGKVGRFDTSEKRSNTNKELRAILKDSSLNGEKKKIKMREAVAKYREETEFKAPNEKVGKALKKYLPSSKER